MMLPFQWHGPQDAPVVVFGNSLGATGWSWHHQLSALSSDYRVLTFELPGHFGSDDEQVPFTFDALVGQVAALLVSQNVAGALFCGVSLGGSLGIALAARHPALVDALVVVNAPIRQPSRQFWIDRGDAVGSNGLAGIAAGVGERWFASGEPSDDTAEASRIVATLPVAGYANACRAIAALDVTADCARVAVPTLVVSSSADRAVSPENSAEIAGLIRGAQLRTVDCAGHMLPLEQPELFQPILEGFLDRAGRQEASA